MNKSNIFTQGLVKTAILEGGGMIRPILFNYPKELGVALMNPSVYNDNGVIRADIRCVNYIMHHTQSNEYCHWSGPLQYIHPETDVRLATQNFIIDIDDALLLPRKCYYVQMMNLHKPIWEFHGLEDARLFRWNDKLYICGVRRDTTTNGQGRMELCEVQFANDCYMEVSRDRMPAPNGDTTYCEKNWMPIIDQPYKFVRWTNPTEIVTYDPETKTISSESKQEVPGLMGVRGGTQVIPYKDYYIAIGHTVRLWKPMAGEKDSIYLSEFVVWDRDFNLIKITDPFQFTNINIEFTCGMCVIGDEIIISYAEMDNEAYLMKCNADWLINEILK